MTGVQTCALPISSSFKAGLSPFGGMSIPVELSGLAVSRPSFMKITSSSSPRFFTKVPFTRLFPSPSTPVALEP